MSFCLMRTLLPAVHHHSSHHVPVRNLQCIRKQTFSMWRGHSAKTDSSTQSTYRLPAFCSKRLFETLRSFTKNLHFTSRRTFKQDACRVQKRAWEVDLNVPRDTLIYSYDSPKYFRMMTICGIAQYLFWLNLSSFCYSSFEGIHYDTLAEKVDGSTWWGKVVLYQAKHKYKVAVTCLVIGNLVLFFTVLYPQRSISKLTLLAGGNDVRIATYTYFGRMRSFEAPLEHLSCQHSRTQSKSQLALKIKGRWFYYLLDQKSGHFHQPRLFDNGIGVLRDLKK